KTQLNCIFVCSGTMEGKEVSPSHNLEESSILDLPSVSDLVEHFLLPHSPENSEDLYRSVDTLPSLPTGVSAVPVERDHTEEMVTQCIVEVLSNALSKPNAPPINPECRDILKKSGRNDRERNENKQLEVRHSQDPAEAENHHSESMEKEQSQAEEESKKYMTGSDEKNFAHEEGKSMEEEAGHHPPGQAERLHTEEQHYQETGREEEKNYRSEGESKESKCCDEGVEHAVVNKKSHSGGTSTDEFRAGNDQRPVGRWHLEEGMQSHSKQVREGEEGEAEEERSEKYHQESKERVFSQQQEHEESDESEETEEEKQTYKPKRYHGKQRVGDSSEEKRGRSGEKEELAEELDTEEAHLWDQWNHRQKHREESEQQREEKSGYHETRGAEEVEKRLSDQGSEKYRDRWQQSEESSEESSEEKRYHHSEESNEKWHEERRPPDGPQEARRHRSEGRTYLTGENEEELDRYLSGDSKEKQHRAGGRHHFWNNDVEQKAPARERKGPARRHDSSEHSVDQQHPSSIEEEEAEKKHHSSDQVENEEKERYAEREEYRSHLPAENEKRAAASYSPFYPLLWWKSRHLEKRDSTGEQLLKGQEEGRPALSEKSLFPEYNDYDWWEGKQILSALNHKHTEKRNTGKMNRNDMERQYKKMDELAQLLNYRKKSAEFPQLYSSGEVLKKHHITGNERRSLRQRPLTEEEEKELENLATLDLELQNIAEKLNSLRRG
ncbi:SCG1 protein, partial [Sapayoa aenigma]|nr:SCG1 protein [Sapayoa aenigma]